MLRSKFTALAAAAAVGLLGLASAPAHAAGPLLFAPWALGHLLGAAARVAALPLVAGAAAASAAYDGRPYYGYGAPYYAPPVSYYPPASAYYPAPGYYPARPRYYAPVGGWGWPRAYAVPRMRYSGHYGAQVRYRAGGYYRRW